jgi:hypothetical protein
LSRRFGPVRRGRRLSHTQQGTGKNDGNDDFDEGHQRAPRAHRAGIGDCRRPSRKRAATWRRPASCCAPRAIAKAEKRAGRSASQGLIGIEILGNGAAGGMVELDCETDFVARTEE